MSKKPSGVALVTGANRGIGFEVCRQLASRGFLVLLTARDVEKSRAAAAKLKSVGRVKPVVLDVTDARSIERAAAEISSRYNHLDVLINNAGVNYDTWETAENAAIDGTVAETITTNLLGPWRICQAFLPLLRKSRAGRIVNVLLTRSLAGELRGARIPVNAVCPGWVATDMGGAGGRPVAEGAASIVWAATLPDNGPTGRPFRDGKPLPW